MLHRDHISKVEIYSEAWFTARRGHFTSSKINCLCLDKEFSDGAMTYIYQKVGEVVTGHVFTDEEQFEDENTAWGNTYEPEALRKFAQKMEIKFLATQKMIKNPDSRFSSTPDGIWIRGLCQNEYEYNVRTVEVKCPRKFHRFIPFFECETPADVKKMSRVYYWQVIDQMDNCGSAVGYFVVYHPQFPEGANIRIIQFNKPDLWDDFAHLKARKDSAIIKFNSLLAKFKK